MALVHVQSVLVGPALPYHGAHRSGIHKTAIDGRIIVDATGFEGDEQGDRRHHGGPEKAVHYYPLEHYDAWRRELPLLAASFNEGGFGENLSARGLTERDVCIGDIVRIGGATLQIAQGRQPCWKLNLRFGDPLMARRVQYSGRTGWYYRVLESGALGRGDPMELLERPHPDWSVARLLRVLYRDPLSDRAALAAIAGLVPLADSWRRLAARRLERGVVEDWTKRLTTPSVTP